MSILNSKMKENNQHYDFDDEHFMSSIETPIRDDAFELDEGLKIGLIEKKFEEIMQILGLDLTDDSLKSTPKRVAKMYVKEAFKGLNPKNKPSISLFENKYHYRQMLVEKEINVSSTCEHHFLPIYGKAHVAYFSTGKVIGLSKINRIVEYYCKRPQVQERLTIQIANELKEVLNTDDVGVVIDAKHMCVSSRGIKDIGSSTVTSEYCGKFNDQAVRQEFLQNIQR